MGDRNEAAVWWRRLAAHERYASDPTLRLMRALADSGDVAGALRQAHAHEMLIRMELEVDPAPEVLALADRLRHTPAGAPATPALRGMPHNVRTPAGAGTYPDAATPQPPAGRRTRATVLVLVTAFLATAAVRGYQWLAMPAAGETALPIRSVAVLPFENASGDPDQDYFADGMTAALIVELARYAPLRVAPHITVLPYRHARPSPGDIAVELGVDALVEGTVLRDGESVVLAARLIDGRTRMDVWAGERHGARADAAQVPGELARAIAGAARALAAGPQGDLAVPRLVDPVAFDYYLRGRYYRKQATEPFPLQAVEALEKAVVLQPDFAAAHGELALAYAYVVSIFDPSRTDMMDLGFLAADRALALDPDLPAAFLARGRLLWTPANGYPHARAAAEFRRAIARDPGSYEARFQLAQLYLHVGLFDEARAELDRATAINPVDPRPRHTAGQVLLYAMQPREALAEMRQTPPDQNPSHRGPHMAWALALVGRHDEAATVLDDAIARLPNDPSGTITAMMAVLAASAGNHATAERRITEAAARHRGSIHFHHTMYSIATAYALMARPDRAVEWLRAAVDDGFPCYPLLARDPWLDGIRSDPGFITLLAELEEEFGRYRAEMGRAL
jgi:TolB-like protein